MIKLAHKMKCSSLENSRFRGVLLYKKFWLSEMAERRQVIDPHADPHWLLNYTP